MGNTETHLELSAIVRVCVYYATQCSLIHRCNASRSHGGNERM